MPTFQKGKLVFTSQRVGDLHGAGDVFEEYECHPKPAGAVRRSSPALTAQPQLLSAYLQPAESAHIVEGAGGGDFAHINSEVFNALHFKPLTADTAKVPAAWRSVYPCYRTSIVLVFQLVAYRIDVTTKAAATIGGVAYPEGDVVASYRALVPEQWRFERRFEFDPRCCDKAPEHPPQTETTAWEPDLGTFWSPGLKYDLKPDLKLTPEFRYGSPESEEERRERLRRELRFGLEHKF